MDVSIGGYAGCVTLRFCFYGVIASGVYTGLWRTESVRFFVSQNFGGFVCVRACAHTQMPVCGVGVSFKSGIQGLAHSGFPIIYLASPPPPPPLPPVPLLSRPKDLSLRGPFLSFGLL